MFRPHAEVCVTASGAPRRMRWRGRWHVVHEVVAHWVEISPWWSTSSLGVQQQHLWRVVVSVESVRVERARVEKEWVEKNLIVVDLMVRNFAWRVVRVID